MAPAGEEKEKRGGADRGEGSDEDTFYDAEEEHTPAAEASEAHEEPAAEPRAEECAKARAVLNGNIAACYAKLASVPSAFISSLLTCEARATTRKL